MPSLQYERLPEPQTPRFRGGSCESLGSYSELFAMCSEMILNVLYPFGHDTATLTSDSKEAQNFIRLRLAS